MSSHKHIPKMVRYLQQVQHNKLELHILQQKCQTIDKLNVTLMNEIAEMFDRKGFEMTDTAIADMAYRFIGQETITHYQPTSGKINIVFQDKE